MVAVGAKISTPLMYTSSDGTTWSPRAFNVPNTILDSVAFNRSSGCYTLTATNLMAAALATSDEVYPVDAAATATSVSALDAPLIAGEFDGNDGKFGFGGSPGDADAGAAYLVALDAGISALRIAETNAFCNYGYTGFAFLELDDVTPGDIDGTPVGTFPLVAADDPNGEMMHFIAPKYNPTFCGQTIAPLGASH